MSRRGATARILGRLLALLLSLALLPAMPAGAAEPVAARDLAVCAAPPDLAIAAVAAGGCAFEPVSTKTDLARGFSADTNWLRLTIRNTAAEETERWLAIGHPRLQRVTLYAPDPAGGWHATASGTRIAMAAKPLATADAVFPLRLAARSEAALYVAVSSETSIDLTPTLWRPDTYRERSHTTRLVQAVAIGALLLAAALTLFLYGRLRERVYLYFAASQLAIVVMDASYTGFLPATLWPPPLPFDIRVQSLASGASCLFFILFVRAFLPPGSRLHPLSRVLTVLLVVMIVATGYACLVRYGTAAPVQALAAIAIISVAILLFLHAWRSGIRPARYLLFSYAVLAVVLLYRMGSAFGLATPSLLYQIGFSWCFVLVAPSILIGVIEQSESLRRNAVQIRSEALARMRLMAQMSHELRAPLNAILGFSLLLGRGSGRTTPLEAAATIERESRRLLIMVDELLDFSRSEVGQLALSPAPVRLSALLEDVRRAGEVAAAARANRFRMEVEPDLPERVVVDARRLRQVLDNLVGNAARYTESGRITLDVAIDRDAGGAPRRARFAVGDTGPGIGPEERGRIFEPFVRGEAGRAQPDEGAGIGLALSRQLVTLMGGEIALESPPEGGSRFRFSVAVEPAPGDEADGATPAPPARDPPADPRLAPLGALIEAGALSDIEDWLEAFRAAHPDETALHAALADATARLDFAALRRIVEGERA
ncbi:sensor histidine kinase [Prosthecomicrobium pneumaticum]|uniref:histidine kinase n=1 Tax=Prosthecomicrobium pneumaticum TaxID=81895 RepID=A0A7W9FLH4_9HYPH|nr:sensor histidine kinase [Prosthecomicrobium pneumaticum]MBB5752863.1 signal transduction histidine kinase [Prosthecomicrobium pneumaticum]